MEQYNAQLVHGVRAESALLRKYLRHERLCNLMCDGYKDKDNALWHYLHHFRLHREKRIKELDVPIEARRQPNGPKKANYDKEYIDEYFG